MTLAAIAAPAQGEELELLGRYELPAGLKIGGVAFGGLSAIDYDAEKGHFVALTDDRGANGPPRFYEIGLDLEPNGVFGVDIKEQRPILNEEDGPFPDGAIDPEALRLGKGGALIWAQEGGASGVPSVGVMLPNGRQVARFAIPPYYARKGDPGAETAGLRDNFGFEALAIGPAGEVVVGMEQALVQDGPAADFGQGSPARILVLSPDELRATAEYVYPVGPVPARPEPEDGFRTNGLVELLARPEGGFYALERAFVTGRGGFVNLYTTSFEGASNVLGAESLEDMAPQTMRKELLLSLAVGPKLPVLDNIEGMSFGPEIGGRRTLVMISDDNFSTKGQVTQILLFAIVE